LSQREWRAKLKAEAAAKSANLADRTVKLVSIVTNYCKLCGGTDQDRPMFGCRTHRIQAHGYAAKRRTSVSRETDSQPVRHK